MIIVYKNHHAIMYDHSLCVTLDIYTCLTIFAPAAFSETLASFRLLPDYTVSGRPNRTLCLSCRER